MPDPVEQGQGRCNRLVLFKGESRLCVLPPGHEGFCSADISQLSHSTPISEPQRAAHQREIVAALRAMAKVRDGMWVKGAPSHVLAEFLTQLEEDGWRLCPSDQPVSGERWTIHVCEACGELGLVFGSEHSIPLTCEEPGSDHPEGRHAGPPRAVEVCPVSELQALQQELERQRALSSWDGDSIAWLQQELEEAKADRKRLIGAIDDHARIRGPHRGPTDEALYGVRARFDEYPLTDELIEVGQKLADAEATETRATQAEAERDEARRALERAIDFLDRQGESNATWLAGDLRKTFMSSEGSALANTEESR